MKINKSILLAQRIGLFPKNLLKAKEEYIITETC